MHINLGSGGEGIIDQRLFLCARNFSDVIPTEQEFLISPDVDFKLCNLK